MSRTNMYVDVIRKRIMYVCVTGEGVKCNMENSLVCRCNVQDYYVCTCDGSA